MVKSTNMSVLAVELVAATMTAVSPSQTAFAQTFPADEVVGLWEADNGSLKLDIFDAGGTYSARMLYGVRVMEPDNKTFIDPQPGSAARLSPELDHATVCAGMTHGAFSH